VIVLDTNVLSALMQTQPDEQIVAWLDEQPPESVWTSSVTVFEIRCGLELLIPSRRRRSLEQAFAKALAEDLEDRILPFDAEAAKEAATRAATRRRAGKSVDVRDIQIAGIVAARRGMLATGNVRHFEGLDIQVLNPWEVNSHRSGGDDHLKKT
jgi:predicted nucleic acid-binding protein